jgi:hypothetical protein
MNTVGQKPYQEMNTPALVITKDLIAQHNLAGDERRKIVADVLAVVG